VSARTPDVDSALPPFLAAVKAEARERRRLEQTAALARAAEAARENWEQLLLATRRALGDGVYELVTAGLDDRLPGGFDGWTCRWPWRLQPPGHRPVFAELQRGSGGRWELLSPPGWHVAKLNDGREGPYPLGEALLIAEFRDEGEAEAWRRKLDEASQGPPF
jgi:hypothetical protein